ncbi:MAG TPA: M28 family metallopeptidase, partial [Steroidobacteraceae bacterium]|nr:M28 family metallopeptidase [Steroidobacteraceae bacterium]
MTSKHSTRGAALLATLTVFTALAAPTAPDEAVFRKHLATLASDEFEGRKPATRGEEKTVKYISEQFAAAGLKPGNAGEWFQQVPLVEITADPDTRMTFERAGKPAISLAYGDDTVVWTKRVVPQSALAASELVFVGYGIVAPEFGWNDYAGLDMRGKTAVILINDPGFVTQDPKLFNGRAMTYHGRWTYKYEEAARQGAAGALIIHDTEPAAYGWDVVVTSWTGPQLDKDSADGNASRVAIEGWITGASAEKLFALAGQDLAALKKAATQRGFKPIALETRASVEVKNAIRRSNSANVIGILPGAKRPDEYVLYVAHWDHLGRSVAFTGDTIFNGAVDNATGIAAMLTMAKQFASAQPAPERSIVFLAVTAEEAGLLGSAYYADNPIYPLKNTVAVMNMDALPPGGPTREVSVMGYGSSELEDYLKAAAAKQDRIIKAEPTPEKGFYYRSDHFNFAKQGVPSFYADAGTEVIGKPADFAMKQR